MKKKTVVLFILLTFLFSGSSFALNGDLDKFNSLRGLAYTEKAVPDIKTEDEVVSDMISQVEAFRDEIAGHVSELLKAGKRETVIEEIERFFREKQRDNKISLSQISTLRHIFGAQFLYTGHPALTIRLLDRDMHNIEGCPVAFQMRYRHLVGLSYEFEGSSLLRHRHKAVQGEIDRIIELLKTAEENFDAAIKLSRKEEAELTALRVNRSLEGKRIRAIEKIRVGRKIIETDANEANYKMVSVLGLVEFGKVNQAELARRGRLTLESVLRTHESLPIKEKILRTVVATYIVLDAKGIEISPSLKKLAAEILVGMRQKELFIRRLDRTVELEPYKQAAGALLGSKAPELLLTNI